MFHVCLCLLACDCLIFFLFYHKLKKSSILPFICQSFIFDGYKQYLIISILTAIDLSECVEVCPTLTVGFMTPCLRFMVPSGSATGPWIAMTSQPNEDLVGSQKFIWLDLKKSFQIFHINQPTRCNNFSSLLLDVYS